MKPVKHTACFCSVLLFLIFSACGTERVAPVETKYHITPGEERLPEGTVFSELLEEYRYIVPETTDESLFSYITKAYIDRGELYLYDFHKPDSKVLVFDLETGKFLRSIGSQGRGPGEYLELIAFTLDKPRREVLISDRSGNRVFVYDADTGDFKRSFDVSFYPAGIEYVDENTLACETSGRDSRGKHFDLLYLVDMEGNTIGSYIPYNEKNGSVIGSNPFSYGDGGEVVFRTDLSDSLFTVTPQGPVFSRFVDFGADALTWNAYKSFPRSERTGSIDTYAGMKNFRGAIEMYSETPSHIWFGYMDKGTPTLVVYNKRTGSTFSYSMSLVNDVVFDKMPLLISASDGDWFIGTNDAFSIADNTAATSPAELPEDLKNLSETSNPVITFVKFK